MKFEIISKINFDRLKVDLLVIFCPDAKVLPEEKLLDKYLEGKIAKLRAAKDFTGEFGHTRLLFHQKNLPRLLMVGLGKPSEITMEKFREAVSQGYHNLKALPLKKIGIVVPKLAKQRIPAMVQALVESLMLSSYEFGHYKSEASKNASIEKVEIFISGSGEKIAAGSAVHTAQILAEAVHYARDLENHPANVATPSHLARHAQELAKTHPSIKTKIMHRPEITKERMGALLAVARGSDEEPKFIMLEYFPKKNAPTVGLVGKGITFDSGGISLKPGEKMEEMKFDMSGGATVLAIIKAAAELKLQINLFGLIPATENLPSGKAAKPGDIIKSRSGKTVEIVNTDAEGRVILSDALDYAKQYNPALVMDFATLTGAIVAALGDEITGVFTNKNSLLQKLNAAAEITGEKIWPMPLENSYEEMIKSEVADLRNIGTTRMGDAINAANFLKQFTDYPWIHLDIAGTAYTIREKPYRSKGGTGTGVRLAIEFLKRFKKLQN